MAIVADFQPFGSLALITTRPSDEYLAKLTHIEAAYVIVVTEGRMVGC